MPDFISIPFVRYVLHWASLTCNADRVDGELRSPDSERKRHTIITIIITDDLATLLESTHGQDRAA